MADTIGTSNYAPHQRESVIPEVYLSQRSVICFPGNLAAVRIIGASARRELTVRVVLV